MSRFVFLTVAMLWVMCALAQDAEQAVAEKVVAASASPAAEAPPATPSPIAAATPAELEAAKRAALRSSLINLCSTIAIGLIVAGGLLVLYALLFTRRTEDFSFRLHWGGFGGGSTGWRMSAPLVRFVSGVALVVMGATLAFGTLQLESPAAATQESKKEEQNESASAATDADKEAKKQATMEAAAERAAAAAAAAAAATAE